MVLSSSEEGSLVLTDGTSVPPRTLSSSTDLPSPIHISDIAFAGVFIGMRLLEQVGLIGKQLGSGVFTLATVKPKVSFQLLQSLRQMKSRRNHST